MRLLDFMNHAGDARSSRFEIADVVFVCMVMTCRTITKLKVDVRKQTTSLDNATELMNLVSTVHVVSLQFLFQRGFLSST